MEELHQLPDVVPLSTEQLFEHNDYIDSLLENSPDMSAMQILKSMQNDLGVTATLNNVQRWLQSTRESAGCRRVPCSRVPDDYWCDLLAVTPNISARDANARLRDDLGLYCYTENLAKFLVTKQKAMAKTNALREAIRLHWETAVKLHFGVRPVSPYPAYTALTCPTPPFKFWTSLMSWAVCDRCGRKDTQLWKTPTLKDGVWNSVF